MPELPEVEFARGCLSRWLSGRTLIEVTSQPNTRVLRGSTAEALAALAGHRVTSIQRRGKWLLWELRQGGGLLAHLGMTGKFVRRAPDVPPSPHARATFAIRDARIDLVDQRLFGRLLPGPLEALQASRVWSELGPDALGTGWTPHRLKEALGPSRAPVKSTLMDQTRLAGLGNIQATEALWQARVHPRTATRALDDDQLARLVEAIRWTLERTLAELSGDEIVYVEEAPETNPFLVYAREGKPCPRCGTTLLKDTIAGRTTCWCPTCQPA